MGAGYSPGPNAGLRVAFELPRAQNGATGAILYAEIVAYALSGDAAVKNRLGVGDTSNFPQPRIVANSGGGSATFTVTGSQAPIPDDWYGKTATLKEYYDAEQYASETVKIIGFELARNEKNANDLRGTIRWQSLTARAFSYKTANTGGAAESIADQRQFSGTVKGFDPQGIAPPDTVVLVDWAATLTNTSGGIDAAEQSKLQSLLADAVPPLTVPHNYKCRGVVFDRYAINGGTCRTFWNLTDTAEDWLNARTATTTDPNGVGNAATAAAINATPATPAGFTDRGVTVSEINDSKIGRVKEAGVRSRTEDVTQPGTLTDDDQSDLADSATITQVTSSSTVPGTPTAPVGLLVSIESQQFQTTPEKWRHTWKYGNLTNAQRLTFPASPIEDDPSDLTDEERQSQITGSSTAPATPATVLSGLVLRRRISVRVSGTPEQWQHTFEFGRRTTEEDITFPGTVTSDEVSDIADEATITLVTASGTPPATPAAPVGQILVIASEQLTDAGKWKHTFTYGNTTALQRIQFPTDTVETDPSALQDEDRQSSTNGSSTPPSAPATRVSGLVLRSTISMRIAGTPEKWLHRWTFGRRTTEQDITFPGTVNKDDQSDLEDERTITLVASSSTPSNPGTPSGMVWRRTDIEQLTDAGKWKLTYLYTRRTAEEEITFPGTVASDDQSDLEDTRTITLVTASSTPSNPGTPSGLVYRRTDSEQLTDAGKWKHRFTYTRRTAEEDITFPGTVTQDDQSDLEDERTITLVTASSTPSNPGTPSGLVWRRTDSEQLTDAGKWKHRYLYTRKTAQEEIEFPGTVTDDDASNISDEASITLVQGSSTPSAPGTPSGLQLVDTISEQLTDAGKWKHRFEYKRLTNRDKLVLPHTLDYVDPSALKSEGERARMDGETTNAGTISVGTETLVKRGESTLQITHPSFGNRQIFIGKYGAVTEQQEIEYAGSLVEVSTTDTKTETTNIITSTQPLATLAAGLVSTAPTWTGSMVTRRGMTPGKALTVDHFTDDDYQILRGSYHSVQQRVRGLPASAFTSPTVILPGAISPGDTNAKQYVKFNFGNLLIQDLEIDRILGSFILQRVWSLAPGAIVTQEFRATRGSTNNAPFEGWLTGEVKYVGCVNRYVLSQKNGNSRSVVQRYLFLTDNYKFFSDGLLPSGFVASNGLAITSSGFYSSTDLEAGFVCLFPPAADFSGFTNT